MTNRFPPPPPSWTPWSQEKVGQLLPGVRDTRYFTGSAVNELTDWFNQVGAAVGEQLRTSRKPLVTVAAVDRLRVKYEWGLFVPLHAEQVMGRVAALIEELIHGLIIRKSDGPARPQNFASLTDRTIAALRTAQESLEQAGYPQEDFPAFGQVYRKLRALQEQMVYCKSLLADPIVPTRRLPFLAGRVAQEAMSLGRMFKIGTRSTARRPTKVCRYCVGEPDLDELDVLFRPLNGRPVPLPRIPVQHGGLPAKGVLRQLGELLDILGIKPQPGEGRSGVWNVTALRRLFQRYQEMMKKNSEE